MHDVQGAATRYTFLQWLSLPETHQMVDRALTSSQAPSSPRPPHSPLSRSIGQRGLVGLLPASPGPTSIKQFYFPGGQPLSPATKYREENNISTLFLGPACNPAISLQDFQRVTTDIAQIPSYCNLALFNAVRNDDTTVTMQHFKRFWESRLQTCDRVTRLFRVLQAASRSGDSYLERSCFEPVVREVVHRHPGLRFLAGSEQFQDKYIQTVIARLFYSVNRSGNGRMTLLELRNSDCLATLDLLDHEDDINQVTAYFSYEHFYVIYCKFWELDSDHDYLLSRDDMARYGNYALTPIVINRIFEFALKYPQTMPGSAERFMGYDDFIWFLLSEEDKTTQTALDYWFRVCDIDADGLLTVFEIEAFYKAQSLRIQQVSQEHISLDDFVCQIMDIVSPEVIGQIRRRDLKRCKLVTVFFNMLMNLEKFIQYESRDPNHIEQCRSTPGMSDWDRFAIIEYQAYSEGDSETVASSTAGDDDPLVNVLYAVGGVANHSADLTLGGSTRE